MNEAKWNYLKINEKEKDDLMKIEGIDDFIEKKEEIDDYDEFRTEENHQNPLLRKQRVYELIGWVSIMTIAIFSIIMTYSTNIYVFIIAIVETLLIIYIFKGQIVETISDVNEMLKRRGSDDDNSERGQYNGKKEGNRG